MVDPPFLSKELFSGYGWQMTLEEAPLPNGKIKKMARVRRCDTAHVIAFTEEGKILLLKEFRPFFRNYIWMLPTGRVNKEKDPEVTALRELQEETGHQAKEISFLCRACHSEGFPSVNHVFIARKLEKNPLPQDETELIEVHIFSLNDAIEKVLGSSQVHMPSAFGLLYYARMQNRSV